MLLSTDSPRPLLLPQNRKVRHLRGVYLRNLSFVRPAGHAVDDVAVPSSSAPRHDSQRLPHALSSENLRAPNLRRRSSILATQGPSRQKTFEGIVDDRAADAFLEVSVEGIQEPVYSSEIVHRATNFNFALFDLDSLDSSLSRASTLVVNIWVRRRHDKQWSCLLEDHVDLRHLKWLGSLHTAQFPPNSLVFHLVDGTYSLDISNKYPPPKPAPALPTSSYNALVKLVTLESSIQDALETQTQVTRQINELLKQHRHSDLVAETARQEDKTALVQRMVQQQTRANETQRRKIEALRASNEARKAAIAAGRSQQAKVDADVQNAAAKLDASKELVSKTKAEIHGQRRRICEDVSRIFDIGPVPLGPPLSFDICGLALPNSQYDATAGLDGYASEETISAALGLVAMVTNHLQYYLGVPIPYPLSPYGSRSSIRDDVGKLPDSQREFPLYLTRRRSTAQYRFDYGWFLLNKNIEALCISQNLKVVDIRHTLPNLKYLLYVCSAGTDEVPDRKRGGFRGLQLGRIQTFGAGDDASSFNGSRRGSADSDLPAKEREALRRAALPSRPDGMNEADTHIADQMGLKLPFEESGKPLTLRTKGLRENVVR